MALRTIKQILRGQPTVVLGSAPLSEEAGNILASSGNSRLICVNGSISSILRNPDLWVLNSREYDDRLYTDPKRWPESRKQLHERMMLQGANKTTRHLALIQKSNAIDQTVAKLKTLNAKWRGQTVFGASQKMDLVRKAGVYKFSIAFNISAGLFGACLALVSKASTITLLGFSFKDGHTYCSDPPAGHRLHIEQDKEAIEDLMRLHSNRLRIILS